MEHPNIIVIGGGPAGFTAALYAARAGLKPIVYEGPEPGGQLTTTTAVENYPGFPKGIQGPDLMDAFKNQAIHFGADVRFGTATAVHFAPQNHEVIIDEKVKLAPKTIIIATGASAKWLGLPSEQRLRGRGVSSCATCDGFFFKGQAVAVVGGGDSAAEEALHLAKLCSQVTVLVRGASMRASVIMQKRLKSTPNITILFHTTVKEVLGTQEVTGLTIENQSTETSQQLAVQGLFIAIGHQPNTAIFQPFLDLHAGGYIKTKPGTTKTSVPGIFAAGDVQDPVYRQAVTAAGSGCMAALDAERFLSAL